MNNTNLRKIFVQLLFSLAIGQVAMKCGDLVSIHATLESYYCSYLHLLLCVIIISSSWVGWHNSKSPHNADTVESVFSLPYAILLVDMFLVICYFIIVKGSEVNTELIKIPQPDSFIEVLWSMIIFITYLFWDIVTKGWEFEYTYNKEENCVNRNLKRTKIFYPRILPTFFCCVCSIVIFCFMKTENDPVLVAIIDGTLIFLFLSFRSLKYDFQSEIDKEKMPSTITAQYKITTYPVRFKDSLATFKYIVIKILPRTLMAVGFFTYLILKLK